MNISNTRDFSKRRGKKNKLLGWDDTVSQQLQYDIHFRKDPNFHAYRVFVKKHMTVIALQFLYESPYHQTQVKTSVWATNKREQNRLQSVAID